MQAQPGGVKFINPTLTVFLLSRNSANSRPVCPNSPIARTLGSLPDRTTYYYHARSTSTMSMGRRENFFKGMPDLPRGPDAGSRREDIRAADHWSLVMSPWRNHSGRRLGPSALRGAGSVRDRAGPPPLPFRRDPSATGHPGPLRGGSVGRPPALLESIPLRFPSNGRDRRLVVCPAAISKLPRCQLYQ
jgi:hypothetical protein